MNANNSVLVRTVGCVTLVLAGVLLLLFLMNVRSRIYYHGPNYGFLLWMFLYCVTTGVGLLRLRKWAVIVLFLPGILDAAIVVYACEALKESPLPLWVLFNIVLVVLLLGIPVLMLRHWNELSWRL